MPTLIDFKDITKEIKCPLCGGLGYTYDKTSITYREISWIEDGITHTEGIGSEIIPCQCDTTKKIQKNLKDSGLMHEFEAHTFDSFKTNKKHHLGMKQKALSYLDHGDWIVFSGQYGSGKTHICDAICGQLVMQGKNFKYLPFVSVIPKLALDRNNFHTDVSDKAEMEIDRIKTVDYLYIDDFLKTTPKIDLIWEIIDFRYKNPKLKTIISTEHFYDELKRIDGAFASRIFERCNGWDYFIEIDRDNSKNERE